MVQVAWENMDAPTPAISSSTAANSSSPETSVQRCPPRRSSAAAQPMNSGQSTNWESFHGNSASYKRIFPAADSATSAQSSSAEAVMAASARVRRRPVRAPRRHSCPKYTARMAHSSLPQVLNTTSSLIKEMPTVSSTIKPPVNRHRKP